MSLVRLLLDCCFSLRVRATFRVRSPSPSSSPTPHPHPHPGLEDLLKSLKNTFLSDVDYVVISDGRWLGKEKPCLQYGLRYAK